MPPRPFANDRLWRCLCPVFSHNISSSALTRRIAPSHTLRIRPREGSNARRQMRAYNQSTAPSSFNEPLNANSSASLRPYEEHRPRQKSKQKRPLAQLTTSLLYELLREEGAKGNFDEVFNICRVLVKDRGDAPNKEMYTAVLHSFVSCSNGTAGKVRKVLEEMGFWASSDSDFGGQVKIDLDHRACECVLEVLAVHPDYLLRTDILEYMKSRWFTLSDRGHNFVVAGLLRERHFEQALEELDDMARKEIKIENWLLDMAMWILLEFGEIEEAFQVLNLKQDLQRQGNGTGTLKLSSALWGALLDAAANKQLHDAVSMVWSTQVQPGYLKPGSGACQSVLALAARYGDVDLATDVFRVLTERETVFTTHQYELLVATYLNANDLSSALSVLLIMVNINLKVDAGTCQPLFFYLRGERAGEASRPAAAFKILQNLEASGRAVPTAAINACLQASIVLWRFTEAIDIYKALHTVSHSGPDTQTFNMLFKGCHMNSNKELAMFFANEMIQLGLKPDRLTYDRLICVCIRANDLEDALLYYEEMRSMKSGPNSTEPMKPRRGTWESLIKQCVLNDDDRAVALLKDYKQYQEEPRRSVERAVKEKFELSSEPHAGIASGGEL